jgi:hypothetical protein
MIAFTKNEIESRKNSVCYLSWVKVYNQVDHRGVDNTEWRQIYDQVCQQVTHHVNDHLNRK